MAAADADRSGDVNIADALLLLDALLHQEKRAALEEAVEDLGCGELDA